MAKRRYSVEEEGGDVDDELRCRRSDGRKWRCRGRVMPGVSFCEYHHLRIKSNSELRRLNLSSDNEKRRKKTNRKKKKKKMKSIKMVADSDSEKGNLNKRQRMMGSELRESDLSSDSAGEELVRMAIKRQMERREKREKLMEREKESEVRVDLPNGVMAISSSHVRVSGYPGDIVDRKIGLGFGGDCLLRCCFRSKNVEPPPVGPVKKLPRVLGRRQRKVCDKYGEESCKTCMHSGTVDSGSKNKFSRIRYAPYFICQLLPVQQLNWEQMSELEIEENNQGRKISGVQLEVAEYGHGEQLKCNYCRISIGDLHRSCSNCSYKIFPFCCRES